MSDLTGYDRVPGLNLTATPAVIIPGIDRTLVINCEPGGAAGTFRQIFFLQLEKEVNGTLVPLATVAPGPESDLVDAFLKVVVWDLREEATKLLAQADSLQHENQRLTEEAAKRRAALTQKKTDLVHLQTQVDNLEQTVNFKEAELAVVNEELVEEIANVSENAPPQRVAFNAVERTERNYPSGAQVEFETVELNEGNAYNVTTNTFRPPVDGLYFFTSGQLAHDTASAGYRAYTIRRNSTIVAGAYNGDDRQGSTFQQSSTSTVADVTQYDLIRVYTQYASSSTTNLVPYQSTPQGLATNFAGYLVY
nr:hypothetical protein BaRGS_025954 [Batillaria attramentaria]